MTDGMIGNTHVAVPDLMERVIAFRTLTFITAEQYTTPNEFKIDIATGKIVRNDELIKDKLETARQDHGEKTPSNDMGILASPQYNKLEQNAWTKEMTAKCGNGKRHKAPDSGCQCGLYCYYKLQEISCSYSITGQEVYCCVACEGTIEAHTTGMRAERMVVEAIYGLSYGGLKNLLDSLEIAFFPIESYTRDQFLNACKEYGDPLPMSLRAGNQEDDSLPF